MHCLLIVTLLLNLGGKSLQQEDTSSEHLSLLWTGRYPAQHRNTVSKLSRDPREVGNANFPSVDVFVGKSGVLGAIESDSQRRRIFFQNFGDNYVGVHHMENNVTQQYFGGMAKDVEEFAFDWLTGNLYWTDSRHQLIMVVDSTLTHYSVLLTLPQDFKPYGLAIHPTRRLLFFSVRSSETPMILMSDLSGSNPRRILTYPTVDHATSLSVDGDKLYWLDFYVPDFKVQMSDLDGSNVQTLLSSSSASFEGIAAFRGIVYVTDANNYYENGDAHHRMYMFTSTENQPVQYRINEEPRKVTFYKDGPIYSRQSVISHGECDIPGQTACDHICLPRLNSTRKCACAVGYRKIGETRCVADPLSDNVLLVADNAQKKIFQLSLNDGTDESYQVLPIASEYDRKVVTMALNPQNKAVYWSDQNTTTIYKLPFNSNQPIVVKRGMHARSMAVDPIAGNVYFSDAETGYIYVMNADGQYLKTLMRPTQQDNSATIRIMQVDFVNRYLYWLEPAPRSFFKTGKIRRMRLNGGEPEVVVRGLSKRTWSFDINYDNQSLFYNHRGNQLIEVPLSSLPVVHSSQTTGPVLKHFLKSFTLFDKFFDFKVDRGIFYLSMQGNSNLMRYNPTSTTPLFVYRNAFFFQPAWLEVYRPSYYQKYSARVSKACTGTLCRQLCFATPDRRQTCDCEDNRSLSGLVNCVATSGEKDLPPDYGDSCPSNSQVSLLPCQNETPLNINPPRWTDDNTAVEDLIRNNTIIKSSYSAGFYTFLFTAEDGAGHLSHCFFTITVAATTCAFRFNFRVGDVVAKQPACLNGEYVHEFTCANSEQRLFYEGNHFKSLRNICQRDGTWTFVSAQELICSIPPTTTTSTTTTTPSPTTTTTPPTTTTSPPTTTTTTSTTTISTAYTTTTTTPNRPSSTTLTTRRRTTTTTQAAKSTTKSTIETPVAATASRPISTDPAENFSEKPDAILRAEPQSGSSGLSVGPVAAVVVVCVVVVIALLAGLFVVARRRYFVPLSDNNNGFRLFWNTAGEDDVAKENSDSGFSLPV